MLYKYEIKYKMYYYKYYESYYTNSFLLSIIKFLKLKFAYDRVIFECRNVKINKNLI